MRSISERKLAVFISLLSSKIAQMKGELDELDLVDSAHASDEQIDAQYALQETIEQYEHMLSGLRGEYEEGLAGGINLPTFDELISKT